MRHFSSDTRTTAQHIISVKIIMDQTQRVLHFDDAVTSLRHLIQFLHSEDVYWMQTSLLYAAPCLHHFSAFNWILDLIQLTLLHLDEARASFHRYVDIEQKKTRRLNGKQKLINSSIGFWFLQQFLMSSNINRMQLQLNQMAVPVILWLTSKTASFGDERIPGSFFGMECGQKATKTDSSAAPFSLFVIRCKLKIAILCLIFVSSASRQCYSFIYLLAFWRRRNHKIARIIGKATNLLREKRSNTKSICFACDSSSISDEDTLCATCQCSVFQINYNIFCTQKNQQLACERTNQCDDTRSWVCIPFWTKPIELRQ